MCAAKIVSIALILAGLLGLVYGSFSCTRETRKAKIGSFELSVKNTQTVDVYVWAGMVALLAGSLILVASKKSKLLIRSRVDPAMPLGHFCRNQKVK
jgi:hypothetical protein